MTTETTKVGHGLGEGTTPPNQDAPGGGGGGGGGGQGNLCSDGVTYDYGDPAANCPGAAVATTGMNKWLKWGLVLVVLGGVVATGWFIWKGNSENNTYLLATEKKPSKKKPRKGKKKK